MSTDPFNPNNNGGGDNRDADETANDIANELADQLGCQFCLGGFVPAGTHPLLGLVYQTCTACQDPCRCCDNTGMFPADTTCIHCLTEALHTLGMTPVFCHTCAGVTAVYPPEVTA
jgi:hypothetical protein